MGCMGSSQSNQEHDEIRSLKEGLHEAKREIKRLECEIADSQEILESMRVKVEGAESQLREKTEKYETAISERNAQERSKHSWQLLAAQGASETEMYRDRFEDMLQEAEEKHRTNAEAETKLQVAKMEMVWRHRLQRENELRRAYERILLNLGYMPSSITAGVLQVVKDMTDTHARRREMELNMSVQSETSQANQENDGQDESNWEVRSRLRPPIHWTLPPPRGSTQREEFVNLCEFEKIRNFDRKKQSHVPEFDWNAAVKAANSTLGEQQHARALELSTPVETSFLTQNSIY